MLCAPAPPVQHLQFHRTIPSALLVGGAQRVGSRPRLDGGPQDKREGGAHTPNFTLTLSFRLDGGAHPADIEKFHRTTATTVCLVLFPHAVASSFSSKLFSAQNRSIVLVHGRHWLCYTKDSRWWRGTRRLAKLEKNTTGVDNTELEGDGRIHYT